MRKFYRGTTPYGQDSMLYVKADQVAVMHWPEDMENDEIKMKLERAEGIFIYFGLEYLDKIEDLKLIEEW